MKKILFAALLMLAPLSMMAQKFGHFNSNEIGNAMPEYTTAMNELQTLAKQYEDDQKRMQDELQKKADEFQKEQANLLENVRARREQELNDLYQRYQQSLQDNQQAFEKARVEKLQVINEKITNAVKKIGDAGGYVYIMDVSVTGIPAFVNPKFSTDITVELKKELGI
ncbi:MAG: OmpH family outer membrane protein [Bacteroidaceae bacterium]|nr:OmpH family outer membrane protein [Bacteroidaceae bacterium]